MVLGSFVVAAAALLACGAPPAAPVALALRPGHGVSAASVQAVRVRVFAPTRSGGATLGCSDFLQGGLSPFDRALAKEAEAAQAPGEDFHLDLAPGAKVVYVEAFPSPSGAGELTAVGCAEAQVAMNARAGVDVVLVRAVDGDRDGSAGLLDFGGGQSAEGPDCYDDDPQAHVGAVEACGGPKDLDCDGAVPAACP